MPVPRVWQLVAIVGFIAVVAALAKEMSLGNTTALMIGGVLSLVVMLTLLGHDPAPLLRLIFRKRGRETGDG
jgi:L-lactate permease